ncbi:hypothetical protein ACP8HI_04445 [Paenibacillus sp. FA6]|uniref:hypothetical protein n=1 Tax=Paenibacillus sp. FA6 TaxID=3413029 RepID=UPI003F660C08
MSDDKFNNLEEFKESIEMRLDIECFIYGSRYYIGWSEGKRVIALCPDGDGEFFDSLEDMLEFQIEGKPIKDIWQDIVIRCM